MSDEKSQAPEEKPVRKRGGGWRKQLFMSMLVLTAIVFLPTSMLLSVGMFPTFVAGFIVRGNKKNKAVTVGAMNLAGCTPFVMDLWMRGHEFERSLEIILDPLSIIMMYSSAAMGYLVYWSATGIVSGILYQKAIAQNEEIKKRQEGLIERWGQEVKGGVRLDKSGFPAEGGEPDEEEE